MARLGVLVGLLAAGGLGLGAVAAEPQPAPGEDLCAGLVQDLRTRPLTALPRPALGQAVVDPDFGTRIRRITDVSPSEGPNAVIKPAYGTMPAWNADESWLILWHREHGHELYDGHSYRFVRSLHLVSPTDIEQVLWDPVDPDVLYYPSNYNAVPNLMRYRVSVDRSEVLRHFDDCPTGDWGRLLSMGNDPMYLSWGRGATVIGLSCGERKFLYDIAHDTILGTLDVEGRIAPQPGPSGRLAYFYGRVYDSRLRPLRSLPLASPT
jgi:hypothetical protein